MSESQTEIRTVTHSNAELKGGSRDFQLRDENFLAARKLNERSLDDLKNTKITNASEGNLDMPKAMEQRKERDNISMIKSELASMASEQQEQKNAGKETNAEAANNYNIVRKAMLQQDIKGRVRDFGGICNEALQELENAAGDPTKWTMEDMKRPEVNDLLACYQGFEDLRDNRTMHGPQTRALVRLAARQQEIDASKPHESIDHQKQLEGVVTAFERGIGSEEIPYNLQLKDKVPWVIPENLKPQHAANLLTLYKDGLAAADKSRYAHMKVIVRDEPGSGVSDYPEYEEKKRKQRSFLYATIELIANWLRIIKDSIRALKDRATR